MDQDSRVRYYACEALYNIAKVVRGDFIIYFNQIFDALCKLSADSDANVQSAAHLLDRLVKDIVTESDQFSIEEFIPLLRERMNVLNPYVRQFLVGWITVLDSVPDIDMLGFLPDFLDGLFNMLSDSSHEIRQQADAALSEFLQEIKNSPNVDYGRMAEILVRRAGSVDEFTRLTSITWINEFVKLGGEQLVPYYADILGAILPCISDEEEKIRVVARETNEELRAIKADQTEGFDIKAILVIAERELNSEHEATRIESLHWFSTLLVRYRTEFLGYLDGIFEPLLNALSDPSDAVVLLVLEVHARIAEEYHHFHHLVSYLIRTFHNNHVLLEKRGALIVRRLCVLLGAEKVYREFSTILEKEVDLDFASTMVQALNLILLTSTELAELRSLLKKSLVDSHGKDLFLSLYPSWCHSPMATISLCLLAQAYNHASSVIQSLGEEDINVKFLVQLDKLIRLLETPVFAYLRLQLLEPGKHTWLLKTLYGLLMLLPQQSAAFKILRTRLKTVPYSENLKRTSSANPYSQILQVTEDGNRNQDTSNYSAINFPSRLQQFESMQQQHRDHLKNQLQSRKSASAVVLSQETKRNDFTLGYIKNFAPKRLDRFAFFPSDGASGGLLIMWAGNMFNGTVIHQECFGMVTRFTSTLSADEFFLVNIYGPCDGEARENFIAWLFSLQMGDDELWLFVGDFNFYRYSDSRNRPGANLDDIATFNEVISYLGLVELPIKGRAYTWSNMQAEPLLTQLDWFFTSANWTLKFPNSLVLPLARPTSDHTPCVVTISTSVPKPQIFRFENHWIKMPGFMEVVKRIWDIHCPGDGAKCISAKLKLLRKGLRNWSTSISVLNKLVDNCNAVIFMLDEIEEQRTLDLTEWNFRNIVKARISHLLSCKHDYWKKRCTARWAKLGSENTAFFHSMATIRYRKNSITSLSRTDGSLAYEHHEKAGILRSTFYERLGTVVPLDAAFDFSVYIHPSEGLESLSAPFLASEIDAAVADLPTDKAPGPDGFNGLFIKVCWPVIKYDFYKLMQEFWAGSINLQSINDAFITLIPKTNAPEGPNDYRPISLLNTCFKLITKLLANRLQKKILNLVHVNQYGFLKSRNIQDCIAWAYEYIHHCKQSGRAAVIIKLDFAKAFDTIGHEALIQILRCKGYDERWIRWIESFFSTGFSSVLLNGVPGRKFPCRRGVRQGDPLSPILFVEGADLLQTMVNLLANQGILTPPVPLPNTDFPIVQYADDTLLIMQACPTQLLALKQVIHQFSQATGLHVNYGKSCMMPINLEADRLALLAQVFGCAVGSMPFPYLGLPLGTTRPSVQDLSPIVDQLERRLNASSRLLDYGGRVTFVNSVLSLLPMHYLSSLKVHKTVIKFFDRGRRQCLWAKEDGKTSSLAAWSMVCRPKKHGGLGVINLEAQNTALLLKQLHKFFCKADIPWVKLVWSLYTDAPPQAQSPRGSFWWRDVFSLTNIYRSITSSVIGNGELTLFWKDFWHDDALLCDTYPHLFSYVLDEDASVATMARMTDMNTVYALPLSAQAFEEHAQIGTLLEAVSDDPTALDMRKFAWDSTTYTSAKYYKFLFAQAPRDKAIDLIWASKCLPKLRIFLWLLHHDRLNTKDLMLRKHWNFEGGPNCVLCNTQERETRDHLFYLCPFAVSCWMAVNISWNPLLPSSQRILLAKSSFVGPCFMEVMACVTWNIWKVRNDLIFNKERTTLRGWRVKFQSDLLLHQHRVKTALVAPLVAWTRSVSS